MFMQHFLSRCAPVAGGAVFLLALAIVSVAVGADDDPFGQRNPFARKPAAQPPKARAAEGENRLPSSAGWEETIRRALDRPIALEFKDAPLEDVMKFVQQQSGIPNVLIDTRALEDVGIGADTPITRNLKGITLRSALRLILKECDLTYMLRDGALVVTTPEIAERQLITKVFRAGDLTPPRGDAPPDEQDVTVTELITSTIAPATWVDAGGVGSIGWYRGTLVVEHLPDVLDEIPEFLTTLRKARQIVREHGTSVPPITSLRIFPPKEAKYEDALERKGSCELVQTPLPEVADYLARTWDIEVQIDNRALQDVGLRNDLPITFSAKELTLRQVLRHMLKQLDLTFVLRDEILLVTTPEEAETTLYTRLYPVGDLVSGVLSPPHHDRIDFRQADYDSLIHLTESVVAPVTWDEVGGPGAMEAWRESGLLIVSQTGEVHREIDKLFAKLRAAIHTDDTHAVPGRVRQPDHRSRPRERRRQPAGRSLDR